MKLQMLGDDPNLRKPWPSMVDKNNGGFISSSLNTRGSIPSGNLPIKKMDGKAQVSSHGLQRKDTLTGSDLQYNQSGLSVVRKKRVHAQVSCLQNFICFLCYLMVIGELHPYLSSGWIAFFFEGGEKPKI